MIRNNIIVLLITFTLFIMAGCEQNSKNDPEPERFVAVSFSARSMSGLLKSAASEEEDSIGKIILFGVNDQNEVVQTFPILTGTSLSGTQLTISRKVKSLYAIANPSDDMEVAIPSMFTVSNLMDMTGDFTVAPQPPFLMSCISEVNSDNINIEFVRAIAKIDIIGINGFQIESITVMNTPAKGYVFNREDLSVPTSDMVTYSYTEDNLAIYIAESSKQNPVGFLVTGQFQNEQESCTIMLTSEGQKIDIIRNTYYQVSVGFEN